MSHVPPDLRVPLVELLETWDPAKALPRSAAIAFEGEVAGGEVTGPEIVACARLHVASFPAERRQYLSSLPKWLAEGGYRVYLPKVRAQAAAAPPKAAPQAQDDFYGFTRAQWDELDPVEKDRVFSEFCAARGVKWGDEDEDPAVPLQTAASA